MDSAITLFGRNGGAEDAGSTNLVGAVAPWLSYLRGGSSTNLRRVAAHNHQDVVTLARLLTRLVAAQAEDAAPSAFT